MVVIYRNGSKMSVFAGCVAEDLLVGVGQVRKRIISLLRCDFCAIKTPSLYQDRLGTNIGRKAALKQENGGVFLQRLTIRFAPATADAWGGKPLGAGTVISFNSEFHT